MKRKRRFLFYLILLTGIFFSSSYDSSGQSTMFDKHGWQLLDFRTDHVFGAGVNRAYSELLAGKKSFPVIVAVIDMGVDTAHEDLVTHIWTNTREIPGNGIDDDGNGYIDDIHGWNFLGGKDGTNIVIESYESYREFYRLKTEKSVPGSSDKYSDSLYRERVRKYYLKDSLQQVKTVTLLTQVIPQMHTADSLLRISLHKDSIYVGDVIGYQPTDTGFAWLKKNALIYFRKYGITPDMSLGTFIKEAENFLQSAQYKVNDFSKDPNAQPINTMETTIFLRAMTHTVHMWQVL
jgi:cell wall-associated protease